MTIGKKNSTLRKNTPKESKLLATGVKSIKFWHEATLGETSIPFGSLVMPQAITDSGLSNPTGTELLSANLALFHNNVEVFSSLNQKLMEGLSYVVRNNAIKFVNGYTALEGEIFEVNYKNDVITGTNVVDARPLTATGLVLAGNTEFNVGEAFKTNNYVNDQIGEVLVFSDGVLQFRNVGNAAANPAADGNYEEVHAVGGFGTIIKFNDILAVDRNVVVVSRNLIAERPDISMMQLIESLGGQLDSVVETVANLAGLPESDFQAAPNQVDLKAFGAEVTSNTDALAKMLELEVSSALRYLHNNTGAVVGLSNTQIMYLAGTPLVNDGDTSIGTIVNDVNDGWSFTALKDCEVSATFGWGGNGAFSIDATGAELDTVVYSIPHDKVIGYDSGQSGVAHHSANLPLEAGQVFRIHRQSGASSGDGFGFTATARTKIKDLI